MREAEDEIRERVLEMMEDEGIETDEDSEYFDSGEFESRFEELFEEVKSESLEEIAQSMMDDDDPYVSRREPVPETERETFYAVSLYRRVLESGDTEIAALLRERAAELITEAN